MAWVEMLKTHGDDRQAAKGESALPVGERFRPLNAAQGRATQIGALFGHQLGRSARKALAKRPSRQLVASALVAMCSWAAPTLAQSITVTIENKTGINPDNLYITGGGGGYALEPITGDATSFGPTTSNTYQWYSLGTIFNTPGQKASIKINNPNLGSFIFQVAASDAENPLQKFTGGSAVYKGYYMEGEITTSPGGTNNLGANTFDTTNVDQFSIPVRWQCSSSTQQKCKFNVGPTQISSNPPFGNPLPSDPNSTITNAPKYIGSRDEIFTNYTTYLIDRFPAYTNSAYQQLLIPDNSKSSLRQYSNYIYLLNPQYATASTPITNGAATISPNTDFLGGIKSAWREPQANSNIRTLTNSNFIISGGGGALPKGTNPDPGPVIPASNYLAQSADENGKAFVLTPNELGMKGGYYNAGVIPTVIQAGSVNKNAKITGIIFNQCTAIDSATPGCSPVKGLTQKDASFVLANPYTLSRQILQNGLETSGGVASKTVIGKYTGIVQPSIDNTINPTTNRPDPTRSNSPSNTGYLYVTPKDAGKLRSGMFLASGAGAGVNFPTDTNSTTQYGTFSQVYISQIIPQAPDGDNPNGNSLVLLGSACSPGSTSCITGSGGGASNLNGIVFSNVNIQSLAYSPQNQILGNRGVFATNNNDFVALCGTAANGTCNQSTVAGTVRNQIVTALNRGSATNGAPLFKPGSDYSNIQPVNAVWGDPKKWYTLTYQDGPAFNVYSDYLHNSGASLLAAGADNTTGFSGSAYGFGFDENPFFIGGTLNPALNVPSKIDTSIQDGATIELTLTPWVSKTPTPPSCGTNLACWYGSSGNWSSATMWQDSIVPTPTSIVQFNPLYASTSGGSVTIDSLAPTIQAIEFLKGVGSFTFSGNPLTLTGATGAYPYAINNNSGVDQTFNKDLSLKLSSSQPLAINVSNGRSKIVLKGDLAGSGGWIKTGDEILEFRDTAPSQTGPITISQGTLRLTNANLSRSSSIASFEETQIEGSGTLPGTGTGFIQGIVIPGLVSSEGPNLPGTITFAGDLTIGPGGGAKFSILSENPNQSDQVQVKGNLSISSNQAEETHITASAPADMRKGDSYALFKYTGSRMQSEDFGKFSYEHISLGTKIVYDDISKTIRLEVAGDPSPTGCIKKGSPEDITNSVYTSICGGQLILNQSGIESQNWSLYANPFGQINRMNAFGNTTALTGVISDAQVGIPGNITFDNTAPDPSSINLTNANTYTGSTSVRSNVNLAVNGSIASSSGLTVESGGTVSGNGFLPATILNPGATIAPGNSIGTLTAASLNLGGGTINAEIQGPQNDRINVTGNVTNFTGTANLIPFGGGSPYPGFIYTIISAPNSVDFATANSLTLVAPQLTSALLNTGTTLVQNPQGDPKSFAVQWKPINSTGAVTSAMQALGNGGANASCTAGSLDRAFNSLATQAGGNANNSGSLIGTTGFTTGQVAAAGMSTGFFDALNNLVQLPSTSQLVAAVNSLSPQPYAAFQSVGLDTLKQQREAVLAQAGQCLSNGWVINGSKAKKPLCAFGLAQNDTSSIRGTSDLSSYNSGVFSGGIGLEYYPSRQWSFGGSYSYGTSYANNFASSGATVTAGVNSINLFANFAASDQWRVRGLLGYSNFNINGSRSIAFIGNGSSLTANPNANGFTAALETDYAIPLTKPSAQTQAFLKPLLGIAWGGYQQSGFSESGGPLSLSVNANTANSFVTTAGLELSTSPIPLNKEKSISIRPNLLLAYQVDALANNASSKSLNSTFTEAASVCSTCSTQGQNLGTSALNLAGGLDLQVSQSTSFYVNASYRASSNASQFGYGGGIRVRF